MDTIREHKTLIALAIAIAGAIVNFMPVPEWLSWAAFGVFMAATFVVLANVFHGADKLRRHRGVQHPGAAEQLKFDAAVHAHLMDFGSPHDR